MGRTPSGIHTVKTSWLEEHLFDAGIRIVDLRSAIEAAQGRIPGAFDLPFESRLLDPRDGSFVSGIELACAMSEFGIGDEHLVIAYDQAAPKNALRLAQLLIRYGHDRVRVLDGGFLRWIEQGGEVSHESVRHPRASFTARMVRDAEPIARVA